VQEKETDLLQVGLWAWIWRRAEDGQNVEVTTAKVGRGERPDLHADARGSCRAQVVREIRIQTARKLDKTTK